MPGQDFTHNKKHDIDSSSNHIGVSGDIENNVTSFNAAGLPKDSAKAAAWIVKVTSSVDAPTTSYDSAQGYSEGSVHIQTGLNGRVAWVCTNPAEAAAVWVIFAGAGVDATITSLHGKSGAAIPENKVVHIAGAQGDNPEFSIADNTAHHHVVGITNNATTASGQDQEVITKGLKFNVNTSSWAPGTILHHNSTGDWQSTIPTSGYHTHVAVVIKQGGGGSGIILIGIDQIVHSFRAAAGQDLDIALGGAGNKLGFYQYDDVEFAKITTEALYIDEIREFTAGVGVTIAGVLMKDDDVIAANIQDQKISGVVVWGSGTDYYNAAYLVSDGKLKITRSGSGLILSERNTWATDQETGALSANATHWVYFNSSGIIQSTTNRTDALFENNTVVYEVFYDGSTYLVVKEDHPACYPVCVSNDRHSTHNAVFDSLNGGGIIERVATGGGGSPNDRSVGVDGEIRLLDHGLITTVPDSAGAGVSWYFAYTNASGDSIIDSTGVPFVMKYSLSGVPTGLAEGKYGIMTCYASKDDKNSAVPKYIAVMHGEQFNSPISAKNAISSALSASADLAALELAEMGHVIIQNNASGGIIYEAIPGKKTVTSIITGDHSHSSSDTFEFEGDGLGSAIPAGKSNYIAKMKTAGTITKFNIRSIVAGVKTNKSISFDVYKNTVKVSASDPVDLVNQSDVDHNTFTGWTAGSLDFVADDEYSLEATGTPTAEYCIITGHYDKTI